MATLTPTQLKNHLKTKSTDELVKEICELYRKFTDVKDYYQTTLSKTGKEEVLKKYKLIVENEFFPSRGKPKMRLSVARNAVDEFLKISISPKDIADLMIFYVERGVEFTNAYGDIDGSFYSSMGSMFEKALKYIRETKQEEEFYTRSKEIVDDTRGIGWGFHDDLSDSFGRYME
ncbi:MAG: hypothetical protein JXR78_12895 [Victivallales bacterium]|nr:hypothetical protein [Victivallales bacterium]